MRLNEQGARDVLAELSRAQGILRRRRSALKVQLASVESELAELDRIEAGLSMAIELLRGTTAAREEGRL
jgi:hypothetical protein